MTDKIAQLVRNQTRILRNKAKERIATYTDRDLSRPVTSWIKEDRLHDGMGHEFTIIFRTCACSWASSDNGGCTMCGYFNDKGPDSIPQKYIIQQMDYAIQKHLNQLQEIHKKDEKTIVKFFSSGSFLDDNEFHPDTRMDVLKKAVRLPSVHSLLAETRPEFVIKEKISPLVDLCDGKSFELGIGMESSNDYVRQVLINKGFNSEDLLQSIRIAHESNALVKTYLLLKPPFVNEKTAIRDAVHSLQDAVAWGANSISLNPVNIQAFTLTEYLFNHKMYRPPWIYSVISVFQQALTKEILDKVLILCSPSAAGSPRGIHNCHDKSCNSQWLELLREFISTQNLENLHPDLLPYDQCSCWGEYNLFLEYSAM